MTVCASSSLAKHQEKRQPQRRCQLPLRLAARSARQFSATSQLRQARLRRWAKLAQCSRSGLSRLFRL